MITADDEFAADAAEGSRSRRHEVDVLRRWIDEGAEYQKHWAFVAAGEARAAGSRSEHPQVLGADADRRLRPGAAASEQSAAGAAGRQAHALPPRLLRPHRPAADRAAARRVPRRRIARRLGAAHRPAPRLAPLRRTVGPPLARPRPLRRDQQFRTRRPKPNAWKYRDYVIRSFNDDKPYDQFVREQLAGDELEHVDPRLDHRHRLLPAGHLGRRAGRPASSRAATRWTTSSRRRARRSSA